MTKHDAISMGVKGFGCLLIGFLIGVFVGGAGERGLYRREAIERQVAEYNPTTGEWEWKEEAE